MIIEFDLNDESLFQKYKLFIRHVTHEIEDAIGDSNVRSRLRWSDDDDDDEFEALRLDFRVSKPGFLDIGLVHIFTFQTLDTSKSQEDLAQETLETIRLMVS